MPGPGTSGDGGEDEFNLELGDILDRAPDGQEAARVELAHGSDIHMLGEPAEAAPRAPTPRDLEAVLVRYLLDLDETDGT